MEIEQGESIIRIAIVLRNLLKVCRGDFIDIEYSMLMNTKLSSIILPKLLKYNPRIILSKHFPSDCSPHSVEDILDIV